MSILNRVICERSEASFALPPRPMFIRRLREARDPGRPRNAGRQCLVVTGLRVRVARPRTAGNSEKQRDISLLFGLP